MFELFWATLVNMGDVQAEWKWTLSKHFYDAFGGNVCIISDQSACDPDTSRPSGNPTFFIYFFSSKCGSSHGCTVMPHPGWCLVTTRSAPGSYVVFCPLHWKLSLIDLSFRALPTLAVLDYVLILTFSPLKLWHRCRNQFEYFAIASFASTITSADILVLLSYSRPTRGMSSLSLLPYSWCG